MAGIQWRLNVSSDRLQDTRHFSKCKNCEDYTSCSSLRITWKQATWPWFMRLQWEKKKITPIQEYQLSTSTTDHFLVYNLWTNKRLLGCCSEGAESPSLGQTDRTEEHQGDRETSLLCSELGWHWEDSGSNSSFPWNWEHSSCRLEAALDTSFLTCILNCQFRQMRLECNHWGSTSSRTWICFSRQEVRTDKLLL